MPPRSLALGGARAQGRRGASVRRGPAHRAGRAQAPRSRRAAPPVRRASMAAPAPAQRRRSRPPRPPVSGAVTTTRERVAVEAAAGGALRQGRLEARGERDQQFVAGALAERVVDVPQAVEVDVSQRHRFAAGAGGQHRIDLIDDLAVIGQAGERILVRELPGQRFAAGEIAQGAPRLPERKAGEADQTERGQRQQRRAAGRARG